MYTFDSRVRYSETDENGKLAPLALMNYLQDCSLFQSEALGVGLQRLKEKKPLTVAFWGDSITVGCNCSKMLEIK